MTPDLSTKKSKDSANSNGVGRDRLILWLILSLGFLFRFLFLALKPPHFDEGINGWFVDQLISSGFYRYDPTNYHGPLHFYVLFLFKILFGRNLWALRLPSAIFSFAALYLMTRLKDYVGRFTAYAGAFFVAASPAMTFYSRYAIHESEQLFFMLLALLGFFRFHTKKDKVSLWQLGIGLSGMIVTKETFVIHVGCFLLAYGCLIFYERFVPPTERWPKPKKDFTKEDVYSVLFVSLLIIVSLYTGFFLNWHGLLDMLRSFMPWLSTGEAGNGHQKPFHYWFSLLCYYEWAGLAGLVLSIKLLLPSSRWLRLIGIYGVGCFLAYSLIPYKTPWCTLSLFWPLFFIAAGILADFAKLGFKFSVFALITLFAVNGYEIYKSIWLNFFHYEDESEQYVYVQTFSPIMEITNNLKELARGNPRFKHMPMDVLIESNWPMPWLMGDFSKAFFYVQGFPPNLDASVIFSDGGRRKTVESKIKKDYFKRSFRLRNSQADVYAYFDAEIFKDSFAAVLPLIHPQPDIQLLPGHGLSANYYSNATWDGPVVMEKTAPDVDFQWEEGQRPLPAPFGIIFSGEIEIPESGNILFSLSSDDGSDLSIDDETVINNLGMHPQVTVTNSRHYEKGWHKIRVRYNDFGGGMIAQLMWRLPDRDLEIIPSRNLRIVRKIP